MACHLTNKELAILSGTSISAEGFRLYVFLRTVVDWRTGIAGRARLINELAFYEWMRYEPPARSKHKPYKLTTAKWRQLLKELERVGLVLYAAEGKEKMVYRLPYVETGKFYLPQERHSQQHGQQHKERHDLAANNVDITQNKQGLRVVGGVEEQHQEQHQEQHEERHTSTITNHHNNHPPQHARGEALPDGWQPKSETVNGLMRVIGVPSAFVQESVLEFGLYWRDRGDCKTSWDSAFFDHCALRWGSRGPRWRQDRERSQRSAGFVERHTDRSWREDVSFIERHQRRDWADDL